MMVPQLSRCPRTLCCFEGKDLCTRRNRAQGVHGKIKGRSSLRAIKKDHKPYSTSHLADVHAVLWMPRNRAM